LRQDVDDLRSSILAQPVLSFYYNGLKFFPSIWAERYQNLPSTARPVKLFSGGGVALGLWVNRILYFELFAHYVWEQREDLATEQQMPVTLAIEGLGWSAKGIATLCLYENLYFDIGGGFAWYNYEVTAIQRAPGSNVTNRSPFRRQLGDPVLLVGLRVGKKGFFLAGDIEGFYHDHTIQGYYFKLGISLLL
jgi:hypothetical protein